MILILVSDCFDMIYGLHIPPRTVVTAETQIKISRRWRSLRDGCIDSSMTLNAFHRGIKMRPLLRSRIGLYSTGALRQDPKLYPAAVPLTSDHPYPRLSLAHRNPHNSGFDTTSLQCIPC